MKTEDMKKHIVEKMEKLGVIINEIQSDKVPNLIFIMPLGTIYFVEILENKNTENTKKKFLQTVEKSFTLTFDEKRGVFYKDDDEDFTLEKLIWAIKWSQY